MFWTKLSLILLETFYIWITSALHSTGVLLWLPCGGGDHVQQALQWSGSGFLLHKKKVGWVFFFFFFFFSCSCVWGYSRYLQSMLNVWWQLRLSEHVARKEEGVVETDPFSGRFSTCKLKTGRGSKTQGWRLAINSCSAYGCINYGAASNHKTRAYQGGLKPVTTSKNIHLFVYTDWFQTFI